MVVVHKRRSRWLQERDMRSVYLESLREMRLQANWDALNKTMQVKGVVDPGYEADTLRELFRLDDLLNAAEDAFNKWEVATRP